MQRFASQVTVAYDFISQMDKEVEEILSSSDDEDTAMDDFVPGVVNDGNDENTDSG